MTDDSPRTDRITQEVVRNYLESTADEMGITMMRTAYSSILIAKDFSTGIFDAEANIIGQAEYAPIHIASMQYSVSWVVDELGEEAINPGDMIMHNDPFRGGTHIFDHTIIRPIFDRDDEELVAFAANRAHQIDMGGLAAGGFAGDATDAYQEGIRVPPVKIWDEGEVQDDLWKFLLANVRIPRSTFGDMRAQIASNLTAEERIHELIDRYGVDTFEGACLDLQEHSDRLMRAQIEQIPDGTYSAVDYMDDDGITDEPVKLAVTITVDGDELIADFDGTDEQTTGPINCPWAVTAGGVYIALLHVTDPEIPFNAGCFRPVHVTVPAGTVLNADHPAATVGGNTETSKRVIDVVVRAFEDVLPDRVAGANHGTSNNFTGGGTTVKGDEYAWYLFIEGGWGGRATSDGPTAVKSQISNTKNQPVEVFEKKYPFVMTRYEIHEDSEGPGEHRGGFGVIWEMELQEGTASINALADRFRNPPWGVYGGEPAKHNRMFIKQRNDDEFRTIQEVYGTVSPSKFSNLEIEAGDVISIQTAGGGGYGDPYARPPEAVQEDVRLGYLSPDRAFEKYGVRIDPETGEISGFAPEREGER
jgi:N-methylhydantoinase B/oxoprolinase/acetone carboxylase alpha subunit